MESPLGEGFPDLVCHVDKMGESWKFATLLYTKLLFAALLFFVQLCQVSTDFMPLSDDEFDVPVHLKPTVFIALLVRNKAHVLPYSLYYLENLDYPRDRISLWIRSDHNKDNSADILREWASRVQNLYHSVDLVIDEEEKGYADEKGSVHWSEQRFTNVIQLRQQALDVARQSWADYILMMDADVMLINNQTLMNLMMQRKTLVGPLLNTTVSEFYANFWGAMDNQGYYKRSAHYFDILHRHMQGCFPVAMVHTVYLLNLNYYSSRTVNYKPTPVKYSGPYDDIIIFAHSALYNGVPMHILNDDFYGFLFYPLEAHNTLDQEVDQFRHIKIENLVYDTPLQKLEYIEEKVPMKDKLGFDQVYMINLLRRPDRRHKMLQCFDELGIDAKIVNAVDGQELNDTYLEKEGIKTLPDFADPYAGRPMTKGEIGCFLSHYSIWKDMLANDYEKILVFEDDVRFEPFFKQKLQIAMKELEGVQPDWDLVYLGRKRLNSADEEYLPGSSHLVWAQYTYWTISYILSRRGATKLMSQEPLSRMVPVDEYLPIMFDKHPTKTWKEAFTPRDVKGLSFEPLLVYPTHYTGEPGYITDTENSEVLKSGPDIQLMENPLDTELPGQKGQGPPTFPIHSDEL